MSTVIPISTKMLLHNRPRFILATLGVAIAFFMAAAQIGLLVGWVNTNSALINHAGVDIWVMTAGTRSFDYSTAIPRHRVQQVNSIPGIIWAESMLVGWATTWQHPEGKYINVEVVGLDNGHIGAPWNMILGDIDSIEQPNTVIIDELSTDILGLSKIGEEAELERHRIILGGLSKEVRTFTATPFVFTSINNALEYIPYFRDDEISYVIARTDKSKNIDAICERIENEIPNIEALTTDQFAERQVKYWMLETGAGITVIITAALGLLVGLVIISQTLFAITQDHIANYATLLALGFKQKTISHIVLTQSLSLGSLGIIVGSVFFILACNASARSPIPLETTPLVSLGLIAFSLLCCVGASWFSIRAIFKIDPVMVFQG